MFSDLVICFCFGADNYGFDFCLSSKRLGMALFFGFWERVLNNWFGLCLFFGGDWPHGVQHSLVIIANDKWFGL